MRTNQYTHASVDHLDRCEDALLALQPEGKAPVFVVIDGMGGHQRTTSSGQRLTGREAAQLIVTDLTEMLSDLPPDVDGAPGGVGEQRMIAALQHANDRVNTELNMSEELPIHERIGAVITAALVCENGKRILTVQVGDTRGYLFTDDELIQLCYDEDNIQYLVDAGMLSMEDGIRIGEVLNHYDGINPPQVTGSVTINGHPFDLYIAWRWFLVGNAPLGIPPSNIVINAMGLSKETLTPQISRIEANPGDILLMASDGIYKNLSDEELIAGLHDPEIPAEKMGEAALKRSQDTTNQRRAPDDISALVVYF